MKKLLLCLLPLAVAAQPLPSARVLSITDGDTIKVQTPAGISRIRLDSIDAPEKKQPFGFRSRQALQELLPPGSVVHILDLGEDRYHRTLAQLYLPDGSNINSLQVRNGYAWVFLRYCRDPAYWTPLQRQAQLQRRGLWIEPGPQPPWQFRHRR